MAQFHHHPDGYIYVRPDSGAYYGDTLANFQTDYGQPAPALPPGCDEQLYTQGILHAYKRKGNVVSGGPRVYTWGDNCIAALASLLAAQAARPKPLPPVNPP
jgi:hypothetical protein